MGSNSNAKKTWTIDDMINLGEYMNFIQICVDVGLTLKELADMYGVSPRTIGRWKQRWATEIEAYQATRKIENKFKYGETLTPEEQDFYMNLNNNDDTVLSELADDIKDWFIGNILEQFEQDSVNGDTSDFKTYVEAAISEIKCIVDWQNIKLEVNEHDKATVSILMYNNQSVKLFDFSKDELIALSEDDSNTDLLDTEDLDDEFGEYQDFFHHNLPNDGYADDTDIFSYTYTLTKNSLSIDQYFAEDGLITNHCDKSNPIYQDFISNVIREELSEEQEQKLLAEYWVAMKPAIGLETFTQGRIKVDITSRQVTFIDDDGQEHVVANRLTDKIVQTYLNNEPAEHLIKFLDNLMNNVSKRTIDNLYSFLAFNDIKITDDGCFTAWKVINYDYTDCYTGTIDNSPGQIVSMPRNQVDDNPEVTCSTGLHVCAAHYIPRFGGYNSRIVKVKVDPKDVISVPVDYKFAKMRTCRYEVLEEVVDFAN